VWLEERPHLLTAHTNLCLRKGLRVSLRAGQSRYLKFTTTMAHEMDGISPIYKYFFLYVEPFFALLGAYYSSFHQQTYLDLTHAPTAPKDGIPISTQVVLNQLSNLYLLFAINEALMLRASSNIRTWQVLLFCLLVADFGHLYSVSALGLQIYWNVLGWNPIDWGNVAFVYAGATMRICFLSGLGIGTRTTSSTPRRSPRKPKPSSRMAR